MTTAAAHSARDLPPLADPDEVLRAVGHTAPLAATARTQPLPVQNPAAFWLPLWLGAGTAVVALALAIGVLLIAEVVLS